MQARDAWGKSRDAPTWSGPPVIRVTDPFRGQGWTWGLLISTSMVMLATLLLFHRPHWISVPVWLPLLAAVVISSWLVGGISGWIAVALSILSFDFFFTPPLFTFAIAPAETPFFFSFAIASLGAHGFATWRRTTESRVRQSRDELERQVAERTQQWQDANAALRDEIVIRQRAVSDQQRARAELAHFSRVTTIGELAASIAHEINQPLAAIVTNGDACRRWLVSQPPKLSEVRDTVDAIISDARRASAVIARIRSLLRKGTPVREKLAVNHLIEDVVDLMSPEFRRHQIEVLLDLAPDLPFVMGDRVQLQQVMVNLLLNGIEAIRDSGNNIRQIRIRAKCVEDHVSVSVHDSGPGLPPANQDQLFQPFFTTKADGLGLGLSISRSIIEAHGGTLEALFEPDGGMHLSFSVASASHQDDKTGAHPTPEGNAESASGARLA